MDQKRLWKILSIYGPFNNKNDRLIWLRTVLFRLDSWNAQEMIWDDPTDKRFPLVGCQPRLITVKPRVSPAFPFLTFTRYDSNDGIGKKEFPWWQLTTRLRFKILRFVFQRTFVWWCFKRYWLHEFYPTGYSDLVLWVRFLQNFYYGLLIASSLMLSCEKKTIMRNDEKWFHTYLGS